MAKRRKIDKPPETWRDRYDAWRANLGEEGGKYHFDADKADRPVRFIETYCRHYAGRFAGKPFVLNRWEREATRDLFGWRRADGTPRFRTCYAELGKGSGKSAWVSALGLYGLCDGGPAAEVYAAATSTKQANVVFEAARRMAGADPRLRRALTSHKYSITHPKSFSKFEVLSGEATGKHGVKPTLILLDELHEQPNRELYDALASAQVKRPGCLLVAATNAGTDRTSICYELREQAERALRGESADDTLYPMLFGPLDDEGWDDPETWLRCHPGIGETIDVEDIRRECAKAKETPALIPRFQRLYLSLWTQATATWADMSAYDKCVGELPDSAELAAMPCYLGLDLSVSDDMSALAAVWLDEATGRAHARTWQWITRAKAEQYEQQTGTPYRQWADGDRLTLVDVPVIDHGTIRDKAAELAEANNVLALGFDAWRAGPVTNALEAEGLPTVPVRQSFSGLGPALSEIQRRLKAGTLTLPADPLLRWQTANVEAKTDDAGNARPVRFASKGKYGGTPSRKIDGFMALAFATSRLAIHQPAGQGKGFALAWA